VDNRESPGLVISFVLATAARIPCDQKAILRAGVGFPALLIMIGFGIVALESTNRQIRYALPAIVALPFLIGILMSGKGD
jgi:hypothetical protein